MRALALAQACVASLEAEQRGRDEATAAMQQRRQQQQPSLEQAQQTDAAIDEDGRAGSGTEPQSPLELAQSLEGQQAAAAALEARLAEALGRAAEEGRRADGAELCSARLSEQVGPARGDILHARGLGADSVGRAIKHQVGRC